MINRLKSLNNSDIRIELDIYGGHAIASKEAFINAGIMQDGWFPGDEGNNRMALRLVFDGNQYTVLNNQGKQIPRDENVISVSRYNKKFRLVFYYSKAEQDNNLKAMQYQRAVIEEREKLSNLASNRTEAKTIFVRSAMDMHSALLACIKDGRDGYHLPNEAIQQINDLYIEAIQTIKDCDLFLNCTERLEIESNIKAKKLDLDPSFKGFMNTLMGVS